VPEERRTYGHLRGQRTHDRPAGTVGGVQENGGECIRTPEGLIEHNTHIVEARTKLFKDYADNHFMTVYGEPSQKLLDLLKAHAAGFKWFEFVKGLEPTS
jgi:hypothetical protein